VAQRVGAVAVDDGFVLVAGGVLVLWIDLQPDGQRAERIFYLAQVQADRLGHLQASEQQRRLYGVIAPAFPRFRQSPGPVRTGRIERGQGGYESIDLLRIQCLGADVLREVVVVDSELGCRRRRVGRDLQVAVATFEQAQIPFGDPTVLLAPEAQLADEAHKVSFLDLRKASVLAGEPCRELAKHEGVDRCRSRGDCLGLGFAKSPAGAGESWRRHEGREGGKGIVVPHFQVRHRHLVVCVHRGRRTVGAEGANRHGFSVWSTPRIP
jgi:hypothetical protein